MGWWRRRGSNPRPSHCERDALPTELLPKFLINFEKFHTSKFEQLYAKHRLVIRCNANFQGAMYQTKTPPVTLA